MDLSAYLFATYVFVLLSVAIWLLSRVLRKSKKAREIDKTSFDKEQRLFTLYQNIEDMLASFEEYVEETQSEADKNIGEMKKMLEEVKKLADAYKIGIVPAEIKEPAVAAPMAQQEEPLAERTESLHLVAPMPQKVPDQPQKSASLRISKTGSRVLELRANGMDHNQIAKHLGISIREVSLAMKIAGAGEDK